MGVERSVTNIFHPNLTIFDENNMLRCILADAEKLFQNVHVFVPIFSLELGFGPISNKSSHNYAEILQNDLFYCINMKIFTLGPYPH